MVPKAYSVGIEIHPPLPHNLSSLLAEAACACARRFRITGEAREDFEIELEEHILCHPERIAAWQKTGYSRAWAHACTRRFAIDFLRRRNQTRSNEVKRSELPEKVAQNLARLYPTDISEPEAELVRDELREKVIKALGKLSDRQQQLLIGHHVLGQTIQELSRAQGRTKDATKQVLAAAGRHFKLNLERLGVNIQEAGEYLAITT